MSDQALVHPYLAPAAAVIARWLGREPFHAGAFALDGGAWGVLGEREAGKSSLLAWLSLQGRSVVCDDMLVVAGDTVFAGPRSVDLRRETAVRLGAGEELGMIGARERWRVGLPPIEPEVPLAGWVFLEWGDEVSGHAGRAGRAAGAVAPPPRRPACRPRATRRCSASPRCPPGSFGVRRTGTHWPIRVKRLLDVLDAA